MNNEAIREMMQKFATELDAGNMSSIESVAAELSANADVALVPIIKANLGVERIVKYNLDENDSFHAALSQIVDLAEAAEPQAK